MPTGAEFRAYCGGTIVLVLYACILQRCWSWDANRRILLSLRWSMGGWAETAAIPGAVQGIVGVIIGHPFDTFKVPPSLGRRRLFVSLTCASYQVRMQTGKHGTYSETFNHLVRKRRSRRPAVRASYASPTASWLLGHSRTCSFDRAGGRC